MKADGKIENISIHVEKEKKLLLFFKNTRIWHKEKEPKPE